jgi:hypothetical protein
MDDQRRVKKSDNAIFGLLARVEGDGIISLLPTETRPNPHGSTTID